MRLALLASLFAAAGCNHGSSADVRPVEVALGAAASLGQSADLAFAAMDGSSVCASVTTACASYPCATGAVSIALGASCPLPLGGAASGTVMVSGSWQDKDHATLSSQFVDAKAGARDEVVTTATNLTVSRSGSSLTVTYTGQDVNVQGASALAAQSSWTVVVDTAGTGDPGDDGYTVTGVQQGAGGGGGGQVSVSDAVLAAGCTQNPTSGSAVIQSAGLTSIEDDTVTFHAACDGQAELQTTTGSKETVALDFLAQ